MSASARRPLRPVLALTQGDAAGVGPEILLKAAADCLERSGEGETTAPRLPEWQPLLVAEAAALDALRPTLSGALFDHLELQSSLPGRSELEELTRTSGRIPVLDPVGERRTVHPGSPSAADAAGALAALDAGVAAVTAGAADALVTAPVSKEAIARHCRPDFRGHTEYLAEGAGLERYGRDYLMAFLAPGLRVALLSTHLPLRHALEAVSAEAILEALHCLHRHAPEARSIAVGAFNPHAGEGGLLGTEDAEIVAPAVARARARGLPVHGPESADSLFARALKGEFDWVLSLYHDQGLIAVKTAAFGTATNWTVGLPYLRTSVDHGTAYDVAGRGAADASPMQAVLVTTLELLRHGP